MRISHLIFGLICFAILLYIGQAVVILPFKVLLILIIGFIFSILTLINLEIGLYILIFVVPFTQQITLGKFGNAPVEVGTDDVFIIFIILSWLAGLAKSKEPVFLKTYLNWPIMAFFAACMFSFIGSHSIFGPQVMLIGFLHFLKFFEYVVTYFIVVSAIKNFQQIRKFLWMFFIVIGVILMVHFNTIIRWKMGLYNLPGSLPVATKLYETMMYGFTSSAILGVYYAFFISFLLAIILNREIFDKPKMGMVLFLLVISFALLNTYSRAAYLGLLASFIIIGTLKEKRMFLIILLLLAFSPIYFQRTVFERVTFTVQAVNPNIILDPSSAVRILVWKKGLEAFLNNVIFGTGYWTTRWVLNAEAHNQYIAILIETGIIGFSMFLWLLIRMFKNAIFLMKKANTEFLNALALGYIGGLSAILATCIFSESLEAFQMLGPLWFVTGLVTSANRLLSQEAGIDST